MLEEYESPGPAETQPVTFRGHSSSFFLLVSVNLPLAEEQLVELEAGSFLRILLPSGGNVRDSQSIKVEYFAMLLAIDELKPKL